MTRSKRGTSGSEAVRGYSTKFDLDRLIGDEPEMRQAADSAAAAVRAGELVRRVRTQHKMSQTELAQRAGMTQAHISELERGVGANGPTVVTLARIMHELGDEAVIDTAAERADRELKLMSEAKSWIAGLIESSAIRSVEIEASAIAAELPTPVADVSRNPFKQMMGEGVLAGFSLAMEQMEQISAHKSLIEARLQLHDLMSKVDRSEELEGVLEKVLRNQTEVQGLALESIPVKRY